MDVDLDVAPVVTSRRSQLPWFVFLLALCNLVWAGQGIAIKKVESQLDPFTIAFVPFWAATLLMLPLLYWKRRSSPRPRPITGGDWMQILVAGVCGQVLTQLGMTWGVARSLASNLSILYLLIPVITAILASVLLRERVTPLRIVCLAIGLAGVLLMSIQDLRQSAFLRAGYLTGNLLILAGCTGASFYNVYCKRLMEKFDDAEILILSYLPASAGSLILVLWQEPNFVERLASLNGPGWAWLAFLCLFVYGASMLLFFYVLKRLPVTVASTSVYLMPIFGVVLAMILVGERLTPPTIIGAVVVLASTVLIMKYDPAA